MALIPLVLAGLAFAGVTVPSPARSAFDTVGITLPNQPSSHHHGTAAGQSSDQPTRSTQTQAQTSTSEAQSKGNSAAAHQHALEQRDKARGKAIGHTRGKAIGLNGSTPPGQAKDKETGPPSHSNAGGASATHTTTHPTHQPHTPNVPPGNANGHSK